MSTDFLPQQPTDAGYQPVDLDEARYNLSLYQNNGAQEEYAHRLADFAHMAVDELDILRARVAELEARKATPHAEPSEEEREARIERVVDAFIQYIHGQWHFSKQARQDVYWLSRGRDIYDSVPFVLNPQSMADFIRHVIYGDGTLPDPVKSHSV